MPLPTPGQPTAASIGKGTGFFYFNGTGTPTWVQIAEMVEFKMPTHTAKPEEIVRYDSSTAYPELIPAWCSSTPLEGTATYNATQGGALFAMLNVASQFKVTKTDGNTWIYQGMITEFGDVIPLKTMQQTNFKFSISGAPVPTSATA